MTTAVQSPSTPYTPDGFTTTFALGFSLPNPEDLLVFLDGEVVDGADYQVVGDDVVFVSAPTGSALCLERRSPIHQTRSFPTADTIKPRSVEGGLDERARIEQELAAQLARGLNHWPGGGPYDARGYPIRNLGLSQESDAAVTVGQLEGLRATFARLEPVETPNFASAAAMSLAEVAAGVAWIRTAGYHEPGDGGAADYVRVASEPAHAGKIRTVDRFLPNGTTNPANGGWWELANKVVRFEMLGAIGDGVMDDTAAVRGALQIPGRNFEGVPYRTYLVGRGVTYSSPVSIRNAHFRLKTGPGGFASVETVDGRYDEEHAFLIFSNCDGAELENVEIDTDGVAEVVCIPVAVNGGMTTRPFRIKGVLHIHDMPAVNAGFVTNGVGAAGLDLDTLLFRNIGTNRRAGPGGYWSRFGVYTPGDFVNPTGWIDDGDINILGLPPRAGRLRVTRVLGENFFFGGEAYAAHGGQTDLLTLANIGGTTAGGYIAEVFAAGVDEVVDCQQSNVRFGYVGGDNIRFCVFKAIHGPQNVVVDHVHGQVVGRLMVGIFGSNDVAIDTRGCVVNKVTGYGVGDYLLDSGALQGATAGTAVLRAGASAIDNAYCPPPGGGVIRIVAGTGAGQERQFSTYVGATKTVSGLVEPWTVTPDATSQYRIVPHAERAAAVFEIDTLGRNVGNHIGGIAVRDTGALDYIIRSNVTLANSANTAVIDQDLGFQRKAIESAAFNTLRAGPGGAARASTRIYLSAPWTPSGTAGFETVPFDLVAYDSYTRPGQGDCQASPAEHGVRVQLSGAKQLLFRCYILDCAEGDNFVIAIARSGATQVIANWVAPSAGHHPLEIKFAPYHDEGDFNLEQNLYQAKVWAVTTPRAISNSGGHTQFFVSD